MAQLKLENVSYAYRTRYQTVQAVKEVSCTLEGGVLHALVGKSGSGKSTLLSLMAGLEKPDSGSILVDGKGLEEIGLDSYRRSHASVVYQNFNLFPMMTVQENVMYPLLLNGHSKARAAGEAQENLERVGLGRAYWKRLPAMLSGGEQQRVAIARAFALHAEIMLADEPTGNLDSENAAQIVDLLARLAHEENCCVVVVTHDLQIADRADRVFRMDSGALTEDGA